MAEQPTAGGTEEARTLLIRAFAAELLSGIDVPALTEAVSSRLERLGQPS